MYYKYFNEQTTGKQVKQILVDILKSVIYAFILTFILSFIIGFRPVYIIGDSMTPEIMKHDVILVKKSQQMRLGLAMSSLTLVVQVEKLIQPTEFMELSTVCITQKMSQPCFNGKQKGKHLKM